jgi:hypothetical protein
MIKTLLIVSALSGTADYRVEMPSMESCTAARESILKQQSEIKTLCLPINIVDEKISEMLTQGITLSKIFEEVLRELKQFKEFKEMKHNDGLSNNADDGWSTLTDGAEDRCVLTGPEKCKK